MKDKILITGSAGFIGYYLSKELIKQGYYVIGVDNLNDYYETSLKKARLDKLNKNQSYLFYKIDILNLDELKTIFSEHNISCIIHLAAQAGVRYSLVNPKSYIDNNIIGTFNILEVCRTYSINKLIYASSSSVYGSNKKVPFKETDFVDHPVSLYAATKKTNELLAQTYSHLYKMKIIGLRFFTVYGPLGRPDMAYFSFLNKYFNNETIEIYNNGDLENDLFRDFTFIDDIIKGMLNLLKYMDANNVKHEVFNIGNNNPVKLMEFVNKLEKALGKSLKENIKFKKKYVKIKPGDVKMTYASVKKLEKATGFKPKTSIEDGLQQFTDWYVDYYKK